MQINHLSTWKLDESNRIQGKRLQIFLFSREEERPHVHIVSAEGEAKFWLEPAIELAKNFRFSNRQLNEIAALVEVHYDELTTAWREHFSD